MLAASIKYSCAQKILIRKEENKGAASIYRALLTFMAFSNNAPKP